MLSTVWQNYWQYLAPFSPSEAKVPGLHVSYTYRGTNLKALLADPELWWADYAERKRIWPEHSPHGQVWVWVIRAPLSHVKMIRWQVWNCGGNILPSEKEIGTTESTSLHGASQSFLFLCAQDTHSSDGARCNQAKKKLRSVILTWAQTLGQGLRKASHYTHAWYALMSPLFNRTSPGQSPHVLAFMSQCHRSHFLFFLTV